MIVILSLIKPISEVKLTIIRVFSLIIEDGDEKFDKFAQAVTFFDQVMGNGGNGENLNA